MKIKCIAIIIAAYLVNLPIKAQQQPIIGTVMAGQVKNVTSVSANSLTNDSRVTLNNTGPAKLRFFMGTTVTASPLGGSVDIVSGGSAVVSIAQLGGTAAGNFLNVKNLEQGLTLGSYGVIIGGGVGGGPLPIVCVPITPWVNSANGTDNVSLCGTYINVGIGTDAPKYQLDVNGTGSFNDLKVGNTLAVNYKAHVNNGLSIGNIADYSVAPFNGLIVQGQVGIGTKDMGSYKLAVEGKLGAREIIVTDMPWADFVFEKDYSLLPLRDLDYYIQKNHHLPQIPSTEEVRKNKGVNIGEMNAKLLQKVEELTLYIIQQQKEIDQLKNK